MKVAIYYTRPFETGGTEKSMYERGKLLKKLGYEVTFIFNSKDSPIDMLEKWSEVGRVVRYDYDNEYYDFAIYDSIHNNPLIKADKLIQVENGNLIESNAGAYKENFEIDEYICVSEDCAKQFEQAKGKKAKIIPNIINQEEIRELANEKVDIEKKKHNFLIVSRIDPQKGFERLEKYILKAEQEFDKDYQFVIVGSCYLYPAYSEQLKQRWSNYNVIWLGKQDNPYKYMKWADVLFQLSDYESQCMVLDESLIVGTPVVATNFPTAAKKLTNGKGLIIDKDNFIPDFKPILKLKKNFEYNYPSYEKEWLKVLKPKEYKNNKFTILIPNYNNGEYLEKCINSVLNQTYKNYEIIFVDDVSTDNSVEIANNLLGKVKNAKIIPLKQKRLNGGARNVGILEADSDYIVCIDSDDWLKHDKVLEVINKRIKDYDVMFTGFDLYDGKKEDLFPFRPHFDTLMKAFKDDVCAIWTKVVKTDILKSTLFPEGTLAEDRVHHYRVVEKCKTFTCLEESTHVWNRANSHSVTTARNIDWEASAFKHAGEMYKFIHTTTNQDYKQYVKQKFIKQMQDLNSGVYRQL